MISRIQTSAAPVPMGPFSQGIIAGNLVFVSAQLARDAATGTMKMDSVEEETRQVMKNIEAILAAAGTGFSHVVKASLFLKDMNDYEKVNKVYRSYFSEPYPARETIQVGALPLFVNIEISMIAILST